MESLPTPRLRTVEVDREHLPGIPLLEEAIDELAPPYPAVHMQYVELREGLPPSKHRDIPAHGAFGPFDFLVVRKAVRGVVKGEDHHVMAEPALSLRERPRNTREPIEMGDPQPSSLRIDLDGLPVTTNRRSCLLTVFKWRAGLLLIRQRGTQSISIAPEPFSKLLPLAGAKSPVKEPSGVGRPHRKDPAHEESDGPVPTQVDKEVAVVPIVRERATKNRGNGPLVRDAHASRVLKAPSSVLQPREQVAVLVVREERFVE